MVYHKLAEIHRTCHNPGVSEYWFVSLWNGHPQDAVCAAFHGNLEATKAQQQILCNRHTSRAENSLEYQVSKKFVKTVEVNCLLLLSKWNGPLLWHEGYKFFPVISRQVRILCCLSVVIAPQPPGPAHFLYRVYSTYCLYLSSFSGTHSQIRNQVTYSNNVTHTHTHTHTLITGIS